MIPGPFIPPFIPPYDPGPIPTQPQTEAYITGRFG